MGSKRNRPPRQAALRKARQGSNSRSNYNSNSGQHKASRAIPTIRHLPHGNPDQKWFEAHPDRQYRIRPKQHEEPGNGYLILKQIYPGCRSLVGIGPEGAVLEDTDEMLGHVYDILRGGKGGFLLFSHDGTVTVVDGREL